MGAALKRPFKMYNIDARAQKALEKARKAPKAAPRYPTEAAILARNKSSQLAEDALMHKRNPDLDERLQYVYVESEGHNPELKTKKKLPEDRSMVAEPEFGYLEPVNITAGKIPLRLSLEMINSYKDDPTANTAPILAEKYKLDVQTTYHILEHFQSYHLKLPKAEHLVTKALPIFKEQTLKQAQKRLDSAQKIVDDYQSKSKT